MSLRFVVAILLVTTGSATADAQYPMNRQQLQQMQQQRQLQQQARQLQTMEISGTLESFARGGLVVLDDKNQPWQIALTPMTKLRVTGTAGTDSLRNGMLVQLTGEIDDHGLLKNKIDELTIVSPTPENPMGLYPAELAAESAEPGQAEPVVEPAATGKKKAAKSAKHPAGAVAAGNYRIVGRLMVGRDGKPSLSVGHSKLPLELSDQMAVLVDVSDPSAVSRGDKVIVKGVMATNRPGMAQASEVTVELAQPLTGATKKPTGRAGSKRSSKSSQKEKGLPEQPADQ